MEDLEKLGLSRRAEAMRRFLVFTLGLLVISNAASGQTEAKRDTAMVRAIAADAAHLAGMQATDAQHERAWKQSD